MIGQNLRIKEICWNEYKYSEIDRLWINLPEEMAKLTFNLRPASTGTIFFLDELDNKLEAIDFDIPNRGMGKPIEPVKVNVEHLAFKLVLIEGDFELLQVRGLPQATVDAYNDAVDRSTHFRDTLEENWGKHTAQILLPNNYYRLRIETASSRRKKGNDAWSTQNFTEFMYFRTGDPPGIFDAGSDTASALTTDTENEHYPARGPLSDLSAYVDRTIPAGCPPDEPQNLHYRSYDVGVLFNDSYIEQMYLTADYQLGIKLLDNNLQPVKTVDGTEIFLNEWAADNPTLCLTREETQYETLWTEDNCYGVNAIEPETNQELVARSPQLELLPQTQYKAQVWANEEYRLFEFTFMTSRYATFLHQIHDFKDAVWDYMALLGNPGFEIDTAALNAALLNADGLEEWMQFEQLMSVFDLYPRALPEQLEVMVLNDRNQSYGLLIESPEPLPAIRVPEVILSENSVTATIEEFDNDVKLIRASVRAIGPFSVDGNTDNNEQWVEILLLRETDLSGYKIEYRDHDAEEDEVYTSFYTFEPDSVFPAGSKLVVYNGEAPGTDEEETEHTALFAGHNGQSFMSGGTSIRLVDAEDSVIHRRSFFRNSDYTTRDVHVIRNQDESRIFCFIKDNGMEYSELKQGIYRLAFTFLRDTDAGEPDLKRLGFTDAEEGQIEFSWPAFLQTPAV